MRKALEEDIDELVERNELFEEDWQMVKQGEAGGAAGEWWAGHLEELGDSKVRRLVAEVDDEGEDDSGRQARRQAARSM